MRINTQKERERERERERDLFRSSPYIDACSTQIRGTVHCKKSMMIGILARERTSDGIQSTSIHTRRDANVIEKPRARSNRERNGFTEFADFYCRRLLIGSRSFD